MKKKRFFFLACIVTNLILILSACQSSASEPTVTTTPGLPSTPTSLPLSPSQASLASSTTLPVLPTLTPTTMLAPTTPTASLTWLEPTIFQSPPPVPGALLAASNADQAVELARWGESIPLRAAWVSRQDTADLAVLTTLGIDIIEIDSGKVTGGLPLSGQATEFAISPDGRLAAVGFENGRVNLYDLPTRQQLQSMELYENAVRSLAFSPKGDELVAVDDNDVLGAWSVPQGTLLFDIWEDDLSQHSTLFSPDGKTLLVGGVDVLLYKARTGAFQTRLNLDTFVDSMAISLDGQTLAIGDGSGDIQLWDWQKLARLNTFTAHTSGIFNLGFSPDGESLATASYDGKLSVWDVKTNKLQKELLDIYPKNLAYSPVEIGSQGFLLAAPAEDRQVHLWRADAYRAQNPIDDFGDYMRAVAFSPDSSILASGQRDGTVDFWRLTDGGQVLEIAPRPHEPKLRHEPIQHGMEFPVEEPDSVWSLAYSPVGDHLAVGDASGKVRLYSLPQGGLLWEAQARRYKITSLAFSPDGSLLGAASDAQPDVLLWQVATGEQADKFLGGVSLAFSPDGTAIAIGLETSEVKVINLATAQLLFSTVFSEGFREVNSLAYSPDGGLFGAGQFHFGLALFNGLDGSQKHTLSKLSQEISPVRFSPDNLLFASVPGDLNVSLWEPQSGELLATLKGHNQWVNSLSFSPDGRYLASAADDGTIRFWGIPPVTGQPTPIPLPTRTPLPTPTSALSVQALPTSVSPNLAGLFPLAFPPQPPTPAQIEAARTCEAEKLAAERYPAHMSIERLHAVFPLESDCDWAALIAAYGLRINSPKDRTDSVLADFTQLLQRNPVMAFHPAAIAGFFDAQNLVSEPSALNKPIQKASIRLDWTGMGEPVHIELEIERQSDQSYRVFGQITPAELSKGLTTTIDQQLVQNLPLALSDLLPVYGEMTITPCFDNYPDWQANLTFEDGATLAMATHGSNLIGTGGPWQMVIDDQRYVQYSSAFSKAIFELMKALNLTSGGQPMMMFCTLEGMPDTLQQAYP